MNYQISFIIWTFIIKLYVNSQGFEPRVVCYLQGLSFREGFSLDNIDEIPCTHVIFSKASLNDTSISVHMEPEDEGNLRQLIALRNKIKPFKAMIQIGDEDDHEKYAIMTSKPSSRTQFIKSLVEIADTYDLDGVDLHWMYPDNPEKKNGYLSFGQELRKTFMDESGRTGKPAKLVSMIIPNIVDLIKRGFNLMVLQSRAVDFFCIPAYNYVSSDDPMEDHHSPISSSQSNGTSSHQEHNAMYILRLYLRIGLLSRKIVLGMPLFGRKYTLTPDNKTIINNQTEYVPYNQICNLGTDGWTQWSNSNNGKFTYKDSEVISYDDEDTVVRKVELAKKLLLGGIMFWTLDMDDWNRDCTPKNDTSSSVLGKERWPVIRAGKKAIENNMIGISPLSSPADFTYSIGSIPNQITRKPSDEYNGGIDQTSVTPTSSLGPLPELAAANAASFGEHFSWSENFVPNVRIIEVGKDIILEDTQIQINENNYYKKPPT